MISSQTVILTPSSFEEAKGGPMVQKIRRENHTITPISKGVSALFGKPRSVSIQSSMGPFKELTGYKVNYPEKVIYALGEIYREYNQQFGPLVDANREWDTDYRYCFDGNGNPANFMVQIDMCGLPKSFLRASHDLSIESLIAELKKYIFEVENSLAMYQLLREICADEHGESKFKINFDAFLNEMRATHGKKIALLAVTHDKYFAMKVSEFGKSPEDTLSDAEVKQLSGFDTFFSPEEFRRYIKENNGESEYLLYVRSSDPVSKLRKPNVEVDHPLLGDPEMRRVIKQYAITFNVDAPDMPFSKLINDTKEYMVPMGMAFGITDEADYLSEELRTHLSNGKPFDQFTGQALTDQFIAFLQDRNVDHEAIARAEAELRFKPMKGTYGCYGHLSGTISDRKMRSELRSNLKKRGAYVLQPEMDTPIITNKSTGNEYTYIDRNFLVCDGQSFSFLGGFRSLMPTHTMEAQKKRIHGNDATVWVEIF